MATRADLSCVEIEPQRPGLPGRMTGENKQEGMGPSKGSLPKRLLIGPGRWKTEVAPAKFRPWERIHTSV